MHDLVDQSDDRVVEQAKGALMLRYGIGSRESTAVLDRWAEEAAESVPEIAAAIVEGICQGRVTSETEVTVRWLEQRMRAGVGDARQAATVAILMPGSLSSMPNTASPLTLIALSTRLAGVPMSLNWPRDLSATCCGTGRRTASHRRSGNEPHCGLRVGRSRRCVPRSAAAHGRLGGCGGADRERGLERGDVGRSFAACRLDPCRSPSRCGRRNRRQ